MPERPTFNRGPEKERPEGPRINEQIRISPLRVVNEVDNSTNVMTRDDALALARNLGLDLVEVASDSRPPVCKIMDYGKFKYELSRKNKKNTKATRNVLKEIRLRPNVGSGDLEVKLKHAREFLEEKDKVQFTMQFKGRENAHMDMGKEVMLSIIEKLADIGKVERQPSRDGKRMILVLAPK